jgi:hypothetical protein
MITESYEDNLRAFTKYIHIFIRCDSLKVKDIVQGEVRVLKKGRQNLFHFLDETTVANHDHSTASFSLTVRRRKKCREGKEERKRGGELREGK